MNKIKKADLFANIKKLKPLPNVALKLISLLDKDTFDFNLLKKEILKDQALTLNVLKICNSPYYGFSQKVGDLSHAISLMGTNTIKNIILTAITHQSMGKKVVGYSLDEGELAKHSISCALAAEFIAMKTSGLSKETAFIGGLLHDIGKIVMGQYIGKPFETFIRRSQLEKKSFSVIEYDEMDTNHAEIGGLIAKEWKLPSQLVEAITYHHEPPPVDKLINPQFVYTVHLADIITITLGLGVGAEGLCYKLAPNALKILKLNQEDIDDIIAQMPAKLDIIKNLQ